MGRQIGCEFTMRPGHGPLVRFPADAFPGIPVIHWVVPPGGTEEDAALFAFHWLRKPVPGGLFRGPAEKAAPFDCRRMVPTDVDAAARVYERGEHPGDATVVIKDGVSGLAVLSITDLSRGFSSGCRLSMPLEVRWGLAEACAASGEPVWLAAAEFLDPGGLMRDGVLPAGGGNPMTEAGFHEYMLEINRPPPLSAMPDWHLRDDASLAHEIAADAEAIVATRPDIGDGHPAKTLLGSAVPAFARAYASGDRLSAQAALAGVKVCLEAALSFGADDPASRLARGEGGAAVCWRNLFAEAGTIGTASARLREPGRDNAVLQQVASLPSRTARAFHNPSDVHVSRVTGARGLARLGSPNHSWLALPPSRFVASGELDAACRRLATGKLRELLAGTDNLVAAFDHVPNASPKAAEARDALALGLMVLAREATRRGLTDFTAASAPGFLDQSIASKPWMRSFPDCHGPQMSR